MAGSLKLSILTPEKEFFIGEITELVTTSANGELGLLPNHLPLIASLVPSVTTFTTKDGKKLKAFTSTGVLKIRDNKLELLCDACEWPEDIDSKRAEEAKKRAETRIHKKDGVDIARAEAALIRALTRIKISGM